MLADKAKIGRSFGHHDLPDLLAVRRVDVDAVHAIAAEAGGAPDVAVNIRADAVMEAGVQNCTELAAIRQPAAIVLERPTR